MSKLCITWGDTDNHDNVWKWHPPPPLNFGIIHLNLYKYTLMPSRFALCAAAFPSTKLKNVFRMGITELSSRPFQWSTMCSLSSTEGSAWRQGAVVVQAVVLDVVNSSVIIISYCLVKGGSSASPLLWCASRPDKSKLLQSSCSRDTWLCLCQTLIPFLFLLIPRVISSTVLWINSRGEQLHKTSKVLYHCF